jgi:hypothetical protein
MIGEAGKNWTAASRELILTAVSLDSSSQGGLCISLSSKELTQNRDLLGFSLFSPLSCSKASKELSHKGTEI